MTCRQLCATGLLAFVSITCSANDGLLDSAFGAAGKVRLAFADSTGHPADHARALVLQPDVMVLVMGSVAAETQSNIGLARILPDGVFDPAFNGDGNTDGKVVIGFAGTLEPRGLALLSDGRIVIAGKLDDGKAVLSRRTAAGGSADPFPGASFGFIVFAIPGATTTEFVALRGTRDGKFLAAGTSTSAGGGADYYVARFSADGVLDPTFGSQSGYTRIGFDLDGTKSDTAVALAVADDGRIAVVGTVSEVDNEFGIAMLQPDGMPDMGFDGDAA